MAERGLRKILYGLFNRQPPEATPEENAEAPANFEQTVIRLRQLVEERCFVDVRFPGRLEGVYQSLILKIDPVEGYVLIDELFPSQAQFLVAPGDEVEITSIRRGMPVRFTTWIKAISIDEGDGLPAYRLALPDVVEANQRRAHFRLALDSDSRVRLRLRGPENERMLCTVLNLSQAGISFEGAGNLTEWLRQEPQLRQCTLLIPSLPEISCELVARSFEFRKQPTRHTLVGARIEALSPLAERQLEQFLTLAQRRQRREIAHS